MLNIGIIGCGNWSLKVLEEIERNKNFNLKSILCRNYNLKNIKFKNKIKIYEDIEKFFHQNLNDCVYVAGTPELNLQAVKLAKINNIPLVLEKPISNSYMKSKELQLIANKNKLVILPNLTNYFSESFVYFKNFVEENFFEINKIIIYEGGNGPFRSNIHPIWDWGFHSFSTLIKIFENKKFSQIKKKEIKKNNSYQNGIITKFNFKIDSRFEVKLITGNLFKKKIRKIKILLKNNHVLQLNMISHIIYFNGNIVFENKRTPIQSLLKKFDRAIKEKDTDLSQNLINISCKTTKILEDFYNC